MRSILRFIAIIIFFLGLSQGASAGFSIDANGWVSHNGASFVPLGMYDVPTGTEDLGFPNALPEMAHLNTIANPFWAGDASTANPFLSALAPYGLYGLAGIDNLSTSAVTSYVNAIKSNPQLLGYFQPDEPSLQGYSVAQLTTVYNAIKAADPDHLVILTDYTPTNQAAKYKSAYDVFNYDYYPIAETNVEFMRNDFKNFVTTAAPKPVWGILQSIFKPSPQWMEPTNDEIRSIAYVFFATGGKGMLSFEYCGDGDSSECLYGFPPDRPAMWASIKAVFNEFKSLSNILVSPTVPTINVFMPTSGIDMLMKKYSGKHYLFAVNYRSSANASGGHYPGVNLGNVTIPLNGITTGTAKIVKGNGAGKTLTIANGSFVDTFPGYATKVYEITTNTGGIVPPPTPNPTATLTASPANITSGKSATLSWSSTNSDSCLGTGFATGGAISGSVSVSPVATTTYTLACMGPSGTVTQSTTITVTSITPTVFSDAFESSLAAWARRGDVTWYTDSPKNGTHSVRLRQTGNIQKTISLTGYSNVKVAFTMGANSLDRNSEYLRALYYNGSSWVELARISNNSANENNNLNPYTFSLPSSVNNLASFALRFRLNGSGTKDYGYVDDVVVTGTK